MATRSDDTLGARRAIHRPMAMARRPGALRGGSQGMTRVSRHHQTWDRAATTLYHLRGSPERWRLGAALDSVHLRELDFAGSAKATDERQGCNAKV